MHKEEGKRFLFRAHAVAAAGHLTKPRDEFLESQGSLSLAVTGGSASTRAENFRFNNVLSFASARTEAVGILDPDGKGYTTLVTTSIEKLNVLDVVTVDHVVARLASRHFLDGQEASIVTLGSQIENLRVAGCNVSLKLNYPLLSQHDTSAKVREAKPDGMQESHGIMLTSIFNEVSCPGLSIRGNRIDFPQLGSLFLGEIFIQPNERRLTMMRFAFGCSVEGDATVGGVDGDGSTYP